MILTKPQIAALSFAAVESLPFAFWRTAGADGFEVLISGDAAQETAVFDGDTGPCFVAAPFRAEDGNRAWRFNADVLIGPGSVRFRDGAQLIDTPSTDLQARIVEGAPRRPLHAPAADGIAPQPTARVDYEGRVRRAVAEIKSGRCDKIVLSRIEPRQLPGDYDFVRLTEALSTAHPHAFVCAFGAPQTGTWLVATPEILIADEAGTLRTMALAGTQWPAQGTPLSDVAWPDKIVHEQALVADFIRDAFAAEGVDGLEETTPATVQAANLCHLRSDFQAPTPSPAVLAGLLRRLHPTSAVCGMPRAAARAFILKEEGDTRGFYTGYFGPVGLDGRSVLYVNLRSARVVQGEILLHVGGGIVGASDPAMEWVETVEKTRTIGCIL